MFGRKSGGKLNYHGEVCFLSERMNQSGAFLSVHVSCSGTMSFRVGGWLYLIGLKGFKVADVMLRVRCYDDRYARSIWVPISGGDCMRRNYALQVTTSFVVQGALTQLSYASLKKTAHNILYYLRWVGRDASSKKHKDLAPIINEILLCTSSVREKMVHTTMLFLSGLINRTSNLRFFLKTASFLAATLHVINSCFWWHAMLLLKFMHYLFPNGRSTYIRAEKKDFLEPLTRTYLLQHHNWCGI